MTTTTWNHYRRRVWYEGKITHENVIHCPPELLPPVQENISYEQLNRIYYAGLFALCDECLDLRGITNQDTGKIVLRWKFNHGDFVTTAMTLGATGELEKALDAHLQMGQCWYCSYTAFVQCKTGAVYVDPFSCGIAPLDFSDRSAPSSVWNYEPWMDRDAAYAIMKQKKA